MSDSIEVETADSSGAENSKSSKYKISDSLKDKLQDLPEVLDYIYFLEKQLKKRMRRLKKLKEKFKHRPKVKEIGTQTEDTQVHISNNFSQPKSIAEEITEAAELATQNTGFVYDESSGLYYDANTGYYYNAEYGLYYDATTGTYMTYKQETNEYVFHSQVSIPKPHQNVKRKKKKNLDDSKAPKCVRLDGDSPHPPDETEEGECSRSSSSEYSDEINSEPGDISTQWPPCMRIIVEQSNAPKIKIGSLNILTYEGGTLGREGTHSVLLPDINISKCHLKFTFDKDANNYLVTDMGSRNGTILNGKRMSTCKQESDPLEVAHGSRIQIGSIVLLCHIHDGNKTCGHCEPGLVQVPDKKPEIFKISKSESHKTELKKLRKKFGVSGFEEGTVKLASGYTDRAQKRREVVGSQNPHEKTEVASLEESIPAQNKGFKMLAKMGWKEGQSLGKEDNQGILEPVPLVSNQGTSGIGSGNNNTIGKSVDLQDKNKQLIWKKTQDRFKKLPKTNDAFGDSE